MTPVLLEVAAKDVHAVIGMSLTELRLLKEALERCEFQGDKPEENQGVRYVLDSFYPFIKETVERIEDEFRPNEPGSQHPGLG